MTIIFSIIILLFVHIFVCGAAEMKSGHLSTAIRRQARNRTIDFKELRQEKKLLEVVKHENEYKQTE